MEKGENTYTNIYRTNEQNRAKEKHERKKTIKKEM